MEKWIEQESRESREDMTEAYGTILLGRIRIPPPLWRHLPLTRAAKLKSPLPKGDGPQGQGDWCPVRGLNKRIGEPEGMQEG